MKRLFYLLFVLLLGIGSVVAQTRQITGTVISAEDGEPVIGASVIIKGTTTGTVTDYDGVFTLSVPNSAETLVVSYIGMTAQEAIIQPNMRVVMQSDTQRLDEVVVTALGIKKSEKILGYAATTVKSEEITAAKSGSVMGSLAGKVAGVNISGAGSPGTSQKVLIRGVSSFNNNQPLYIVDGVPINNERIGNREVDFGNSANDINPEDVESVTVLKGASATALYGSRAANGVIMITTKNAGKENLTITYDGSFTASNSLRVMQTQDIFGQGWGSWSRDENGSWGPRLDGTIREWGSDKLDEPLEKPFSYVKNNMRNFYKTSLETNNVVTLRYGTENVGLVASYGHFNNDGILPGKGDTNTRNAFSLRGFAQADKLRIDASMNYTRKDIGRTYGMEMQLLQHAVDVSYETMKDYTDERYNLDNYYTFYASNPYWRVDNFRYNYQDDHIYGKLELGYDLIPGLKAVGRIGGDFLNYRTSKEEPIYTFTPGSYSDLGGKSIGEGYYDEYSYSTSQIDATAFLSADYRIEDFSIGGSVGWNLNTRSFNRTGAYVEGLDIPGWYHLANTGSGAIVDTKKWQRRLIGAFGQIELGYKDYLFLNLSARNDWSSTLPIDKNSFFYGGINVSFIATELFPQLKDSQINFLKLRAAVGQTGNDADVYLTKSFFTVVSNSTANYYYTWLPINGMAGLTENNTLANANLKPEMTTEFEFGISGSFWDNRISLDAAYYNRQTKDQIIEANLAPETGYTKQTRNIGHIENQGIELMASITPIRTRDWTWEVGATFAKNWSLVKELWDDVQEYNIYNTRGVHMLAIVGEPLGVFRIPATEKVTDEKSPYYGYTVVNNNGFISESDTETEIIGCAQPDFTMGFNTNLRYKSFSLNIIGDWRKGGYMYSGTAYITHFNGNSTQTVFNERNSFVVPNSVKIVNGEYVENNIMVRADQMNYALGNYSYNPEIRRNLVLPKDYFKIREIVLSYSVPNKYLLNTPIAAASVSLIGRNLFLFTPKRNNYIDPEVTNYGNDLESEFGESTGLGSMRNYGVGVKLTF